jgi:hypothetical protein
MKPSKDIIDRITDYKLNTLRNSIRGTEAFEKAVSNAAAKLKHKADDLGSELDIRTVSAQDMCECYYTMLSDYRQKHNFTNYKKINRSAVAFWFRVVEACQKADLPPKDYLQAQFSYFHTTFGTAPTLPQLITENALERAKSVVKLKTKIVASSIASNITLPEVFKECDKQVRNICRAQKMTREEFYSKLVLTGEYPLPVSFLKADPVYNKVANA